MADGEVRAQDLAQETASTLSGNEQFVMFDSTAGKRADIDDVATYVAGDKTTLKTTNKTSPVAAINENFDAIADVKEDLTQATGYTSIPVAINKSIDTNTTYPILPERIKTENGWCCACIACSEGDVFGVTGKGGSSTRLWAFSTSDGTRLIQSGSGANETDYKLVAPANAAYFAFNSQTNVPYNVYKGVKIVPQLTEIRNSISPLPFVALQFTAIASKAHNPSEDVLKTQIKTGTNFYLCVLQTGNRDYRFSLNYSDGTSDTWSWRTLSKRELKQVATKDIISISIETTSTGSASVFTVFVAQQPYGYGLLFPFNRATYDKLLPCYDHLFQNSSPTIIPPESLFHVRLSRRLGFNMIEANVNKTSDSVCVVTHGLNGKFGPWFHSADGLIDVPNTKISDVTWQWVVDNVRYDSTIEKYRTRPPRLEEFLSECKQQGLMVLLQTGESSDVIEMAEEIMGKENYIAYAATRENCPNGMIYQWRTDSTKAAIISYCESIGAPMIYGMADPTQFTDAEITEIAEELHKRGFLLGTSYADALWSGFSYLGFDILGANRSINRIDYGNIVNITSEYGFNGYSVVGATETGGVLTFNSNGTITPVMDNNTYPLCAVDIEVLFDGTIEIPAIGEQANAQSYTSDGSYPVFVCYPIFNGDPKKTISVSSGTVVYDLNYKASEL